MTIEVLLDDVPRRLKQAPLIRLIGTVTDIVGLVIESRGPEGVAVGDMCLVRPSAAEAGIDAEVVGFRGGRVLLMALGHTGGLRAGAEVIPMGRRLAVRVGDDLIGRVLDGLGAPLDSKLPVEGRAWASIHRTPPNPLDRPRIRTPLWTGVRAIDGCLTLGRGQRIGIMSGSGVGKSTLLATIARQADADLAVTALVGERGREVNEFIDILAQRGLERSVVIVATSDQPPMVRATAPLVATAVAEWFRDQGQNVLLLMDSVTRWMMALREIGLAAGEPPTTRGYTPSAFAHLPRLLERAGTSPRGSITGLYTVLVEGDDLSEPVADAARSILDGHLVLSRSMAERGWYPPIDILQSLSRVMPQVVGGEHLALAAQVRDHLAALREAEDLLNIGAYTPGSNPRIDRARQALSGLETFLRQNVNDVTQPGDLLDRLRAALGRTVATLSGTPV
jgi:flagellum-specific ATP synthase